MWTPLELRHVDLGDRRLDRRLVKLVHDLLAAPEASVPRASGDWAATKAAYRFFSNPRVDECVILAGHLAATRARFAAESFAPPLPASPTRSS